MAVHVLTWDFAILRVDRSGCAPVFVPRPADDLEAFLAEFERGDAADWLDRVLARRPRSVLRRVPRATRTRRATSVGVEHEYSVLRRGEPVDFKMMIHDLGIEGIRADPADPNAYRCAWGGVVTADGIEAEVATPPVALGPDAITEVEGLCRAGRALIEGRLDEHHELVGYSTHLSVTVPDRGSARRALRYCRTFAPGLMLLLDRADSPGLLVRPRPNRLELGGEFADGDRLAIALAYAVASTLALVAQPRGFTDLEVQTRLVPSRQRYGHLVAPGAFGSDLYARGRSARLVRRSATVTAQHQLEQTWERSRAHVEGLLAAEAVDAVDQAVRATTALPAPATVAPAGTDPRSPSRGTKLAQIGDVRSEQLGDT